MEKILSLLAIALSKVSNTCKACKKKQYRIPYLDQNWLRATKNWIILLKLTFILFKLFMGVV